MPQCGAILPSRIQRVHGLISVENVLQIRHAEQVKHGKILFTMPAMRGRIDKHRFYGSGIG